jgi:hypothetical protein
VKQHLYAVGQHVSYAESGTAGSWKGGYAIVALLPNGADEPQYQISNADQSYDRVVQEHELTEDLSARERGR